MSWGTRPDGKTWFVDKFEEVAGDVICPQWSHAYNETPISSPAKFAGVAETTQRQKTAAMATIAPGERLVFTVAEDGRTARDLPGLRLRTRGQGGAAGHPVGPAHRGPQGRAVGHGRPLAPDRLSPATIMLSIGKMVAGAEDYYLGIVAQGKEEYYTGTGEARGSGWGVGSRPWASVGKSPRTTSGRILAGVSPQDGSPPRPPARRHVRVTGFDLTFSAPKSVSVLWGLERPGDFGCGPGRPRRGGRRRARLPRAPRHHGPPRGPAARGGSRPRDWWRPASCTAPRATGTPSCTRTCWPPTWCSARTVGGPLPTPACSTSMPARPASSTRRRSGPTWSNLSVSRFGPVVRGSGELVGADPTLSAPLLEPPGRDRGVPLSAGRELGADSELAPWPRGRPSQATTPSGMRSTFVPYGAARPSR